jgi:hypothetical protein
MASPTAVRRALAALLDGLDVRVTPAPVDYATDRGFDKAQYMVRVRVGSAESEAVAESLDRLLDPDDDTSIKQRLEADRTLDGLVSNVQVVKSSGYQIFPPDGVLGATFTVQVL